MRTMPPLRELAPQPMVCESKTATVAPDFASDLAAERPVNPAPIMATSTRCGSSRVTAAGISTVSSQNVFSCMGRISLPNSPRHCNREWQKKRSSLRSDWGALEVRPLQRGKAAGLRRLRPALQRPAMASSMLRWWFWLLLCPGIPRGGGHLPGMRRRPHRSTGL